MTIADANLARAGRGVAIAVALAGAIAVGCGSSGRAAGGGDCAGAGCVTPPGGGGPGGDGGGDAPGDVGGASDGGDAKSDASDTSAPFTVTGQIQRTTDALFANAVAYGGFATVQCLGAGSSSFGTDAGGATYTLSGVTAGTYACLVQTPAAADLVPTWGRYEFSAAKPTVNLVVVDRLAYQTVLSSLPVQPDLVGRAHGIVLFRKPDKNPAPGVAVVPAATLDLVAYDGGGTYAAAPDAGLGGTGAGGVALLVNVQAGGYPGAKQGATYLWSGKKIDDSVHLMAGAATRIVVDLP